MAEGEFNADTVLGAILGKEANGVSLHTVLVTHTKTHLLTFVSDEGEIQLMADMPASPPEWMETFAEAWAKVADRLGPMPAVVSKRATTWAGMDADVKEPPKPAAATAWSSGAPGVKSYSAVKTVAGKSSMTDDKVAEMMDGLIVSDHDVPKAIEDILAQRISGVRCVALSLALMSGHVHPAGESSELRFGSDLRLCPLIRQQRKAGVQSLDDIVKAKNKRELSVHYSRLAKEYNERGMIEEATLVSQFWAESTSTFEGDDAGLFTYVSEWNRSYAGRGIPKILDTDLILRHRKADGGGASSSELKKVEDAVKSAEKLLNKSEERNNALMKRLQKLEAKADNPGGGGGDKSCFICGGDHLARNCPEKKKPKPGKGKEKEVVIVEDDE